QGEGVPTIERVAHRFGEVTLAGEAQELSLAPGMEGFDARQAFLPANGKTLLRRPSGDLPLDVVERADAIERFSGDRRAGGLPHVMKVPAQMCPARGFSNASLPGHITLVEFPEAGIGVGLQDAFEVGEMALRMLTLPVRREPVGGTGRVAAGPGPIVPNID